MVTKVAAGFVPALLAALAAAAPAQPARAIGLVNGGFEEPDIPEDSSGDPFFLQLPQADVTGWQTTSSDDLIELWSSGFNDVPAFEGNQFAEINATQDAELFQDVSGIDAGAVIGWEFAPPWTPGRRYRPPGDHRPRNRRGFGRWR